MLIPVLFVEFTEEVMSLETSNESRTPSEVVSERAGDTALNPAVVFTTNRYKFNSSVDHRYSICANSL